MAPPNAKSSDSSYSAAQWESLSLYEKLGVSRNSTTREITTAYRKLAMKYHPDKGGDENIFKEITQAHEILTDDNKRQIYDMHGLAGLQGGMSGGPSEGINIFDLFFGGSGPKNSGPRKGASETRTLGFTLEEFNSGVSKKISINRKKVCTICNGRGAASEHIKTCHVCGGAGRVIETFKTVGYISQRNIDCVACHSSGKIIDPSNRCKSCKGACIIRESENIDVILPPGAPNGYKIVCHGKADEAPNVITGDLIIVAQEKEHPVFKRRGNDLVCNWTISLRQSLLKEPYAITNITGQKILIKPESIIAPDMIIMVPNHGMTILNSMGRGNLYIHHKVQFPTSISREHLPILNSIFPDPANIKKISTDGAVPVPTKMVNSMPTASNDNYHKQRSETEDEHASNEVSCNQM
uniref:DnaJ protein homolog 2-like n=1 Tax=Dermatophagoides pteronyssinus TaxID=6956 RepID=A0A6P6XKY7_DERPT|nr:dnaJ protein homolog 2-like [Dermatophagoides pteronyssinus]